MSLDERTGRRDLLYSAWHRPRSINRFVPDAVARILKTCDIDWCEACHWCSLPLALIETQRSNAAPKSAAVTQRLAFLAGIPAYSLSYVSAPIADCGAIHKDCNCNTDIELVRVQRIFPKPTPVAEMTPGAWSEFLVSMRWSHDRDSYDCAEKSAGIRALTGSPWEA